MGRNMEIKAKPTDLACGGLHVILLTSVNDAVAYADVSRRAEMAVR